MSNYYGYPPGYDPNPHHPRSSPPALAPIPSNRLNRAGQDGGQWISPDGDWIYTERFGLWRAAWDGSGYGAWERAAAGLPEGVVRL